MNEEEKYFDYTLEPGKIREKEEFKYEGKPLISIITPYYNSKNYIMQTANSIFNQTFPYWEWILVNDGSTEDGTEEILEELQKMDSRVKVFKQENKGRIITRDEAIKRSQAELLFIIDSDDMIDKTMMECCYWTLQTNPKASWVYADLVNFDGKEFLWKKIFDFNMEKKENILPVCSLIRKEHLLSVGGYGVVDKDVHEDWHLWLRMLEKGYFPIRMNYYGFWYRNKKEGGILASINNDKERDRHAKEEIRKQASKIKDNIYAIQFPTTTNSNYDSYPYTFNWDKGAVNKKREKIRLLFILPWFKVGGADKFNLDLISNLDQEKYDITILTTETSDYIWRQRFEKYGEVFDLTSFLHRKDWPAFVHYIMKTRNTDIVMTSNSYFGFYAVPWLKSEFPEVVFTDYLHSQNWNWRNGEYPRDSVAIAGFLDKTYTCTKMLKGIMKEKMGRTVDNVKTVYIGVDEKEFDENKVDIENYTNITEKKAIYNGKKVILFVCRISEEKRPILMIKIMNEVLKNRKDVVLFVVGDGPELDEMKRTASSLKIDNNIIFWGMQEEVKPFYKLADVSVICSLVEGLAITAYESLAMKTPVVTANVGGQEELIDNTCGKVVKNIQTSENGMFNRDYSDEEIQRYLNAICEILDNKEYEKIRENARNKILNGFTIKNMINILDKDFTSFFENGTTVNKESVVNKDLYNQYIVLYNQLDIRNYFPREGGDMYDVSTDYRIGRIKGKLWNNIIWRTGIKTLKKLGIIKLLKRLGIDKRIKTAARKIIK